MTIKSIREVLNGREFPAISPDATLEAASDLMQEARVSAVPVVLNGDLLGIVGERDILRHVSQRGGFATSRVAEVMTCHVVSIETRSSIMDAVVQMQASGFRQLPVTDLGDKVVGLLTVDDIPVEYMTMREQYVMWRGAMAAE